MSKSAAAMKVVPQTDTSKLCKSAFTLTFAVEIVGLEVFQDLDCGYVELEPVNNGAKLSYTLYPGQTYDLDILIWPHVAKIFCGNNYTWVRTWQFLERRWLAFSIRHAFPVRVTELRSFRATVTPAYGIGAVNANVKSDTKNNVFLPSLYFGERREFAFVIEADVPLRTFIKELIWSYVVVFIPATMMDGLFDIPYPVQDVRNQDPIFFNITKQINAQNEQHQDTEAEKEKDKKADQKKKPEVKPIKYEIGLLGDSILSGIGRVVPFEAIGDRPADQGVVISLISSINLPAQDDLPVAFVNVTNLTSIPLNVFKKHKITHIYTRWTISDEEHCSEQQPLTEKSVDTVDFDDHHSVPLPYQVAPDVMATFSDERFKIELRGIRIPPPITEKPVFFGYEKKDRDFGEGIPPRLPNQETDILIAYTKIDVKSLSRMNGFIYQEFPLYPPQTSVESLEREGVCTNDINAVRAKIKPDLIVQPGDVLEAQMLLRVSLGLVGCKPSSRHRAFGRIYCLISDPEPTMMILRQITELNELLLRSGNRDNLLTGFGLDTGDTVILYVEGPKDGRILHVWERMEDFYPNVKPVFCTASKYRSRLYPELLLAAMPFNIMKMFVPLSLTLSLTPIYARPALPLPTRSALLKIGTLVASKLRRAPTRDMMPTAMELKSFRLELCVAPRPPAVLITSGMRAVAGQNQQGGAASEVASVSRINWERNENDRKA